MLEFSRRIHKACGLLHGLESMILRATELAASHTLPWVEIRIFVIHAFLQFSLDDWRSLQPPNRFH